MPADDGVSGPHQTPAIRRLRLDRFRNYAALDLAFPGNPVALTGPNGAGKTNLLEALSLFNPGRGLRRARYADMALRDEGATPGGWAASAEVASEGHVTTIGTGMPAPAEDGASGRAGGGRTVRIEGVTRPAEMLLDHLRILWLTPAMDRLFAGPPGDRRRFLDRLVMTVDPAHGRRVNSFERAMRNRNRLLAEGAQAAWLDAAERELAGAAVAVADARRRTVARLTGWIGTHSADEAGFPAAELALDGPFEDFYREATGDVAASGADARAVEAYRELLRRDRTRDLAAGRTLAGPHTGDLSVLFADKGMPAALSSTGEQKALLIGMVLAHAGLVAQVSGLVPVLLLDEVAAHLDAERRAALFARLAAMGGQVFMTGTDAALFAALPAGACRYHVDSGRISAQN